MAKTPGRLGDGGGGIALFIPVGSAEATPFTRHVTLWFRVGTRISITAAFYLPNWTEFNVAQTWRVCVRGLCLPDFTEISISVCGHRFFHAVASAHGKLCKGLGQGEVTWSAV